MHLQATMLIPWAFMAVLLSSVSCYEPVVTLDQGQLKGTRGKNVDGGDFYKFLGIPYAQPPINDLRFKLPLPGTSWQGVRDATKAGDTCISVDNFSINIIGSENCLYANVYTRHLPGHPHHNTPLRPVMVYIYGGGLTLGSSRPEVLGPEFLLLKDIVLVTFNYRLGVLGFLSSDDPSLNLPGNLGLKDQLLLLKWVKQNIRKFNGDPDNVTIFGNSAGASSVHIHVLSPGSRGLFHKAIMQSACALTPDFWGSKNNVREVASKAGKSAVTDKEALEVLKTLSVKEVYAAQAKVVDSPYPADKRPFGAVLEYSNPSAIITKTPVDLIKDGRYSQVPIMMGYTDKEGMLYDLADDTLGTNLTDSNLEKLIPINIQVVPGSDASREIIRKLRQLYAGKPYDDRYDPITDSVLLATSIEALILHLQRAQNPIFLYRMSLDAGLNQLKLLLNWTNKAGAAHTDELGYLFNSTITPTITPGSLEDRSMRAFVELWTNFATCGNPTPDRDLNVVWKPVKSGNDIRVLDIGKQIEMKDIPERNRLSVWREIFERWPLVKF